METTQTTSATCTCSNFGCDVRIKRGLTPFCKITAPVAYETRGPATKSWHYGFVARGR